MLYILYGSNYQDVKGRLSMTDYVYDGYREDQDLEFLARVKNEDLNDLVVIIKKIIRRTNHKRTL